MSDNERMRTACGVQVNPGDTVYDSDAKECVIDSRYPGHYYARELKSGSPSTISRCYISYLQACKVNMDLRQGEYEAAGERYEEARLKYHAAVSDQPKERI